MMLAPLLTGQRLHLRELQTDDWRFIQNMRGPDLSRRSAAESQAFLTRLMSQQQADPRTFYRWIVVLRPNAIPIGWCDLYLDPAKHETVELGYRIDARWCGHGYATEAALLLLTNVFAHTTVWQVWAMTERTNHASQRVLAKLGMQDEGPQADSTHRFVLTRSAWNK